MSSGECNQTDLLRKWDATAVEIKQNNLPITASPSNSTDSSKLLGVVKSFRKMTWSASMLAVYAGKLHETDKLHQRTKRGACCTWKHSMIGGQKAIL